MENQQLQVSILHQWFQFLVTVDKTDVFCSKAEGQNGTVLPFPSEFAGRVEKLKWEETVKTFEQSTTIASCPFAHAYICHCFLGKVRVYFNLFGPYTQLVVHLQDMSIK